MNDEAKADGAREDWVHEKEIDALKVVIHEVERTRDWYLLRSLRLKEGIEAILHEYVPADLSNETAASKLARAVLHN